MRPRRARRGWPLIALFAAATTACHAAAPVGQACTEIGAQPGVSVVVERAVVERTTATDPLTLRLRICQTDCVDQTVELQPGSVTVDEDCPTTDPGKDPDVSCSASSSPDGTLIGFADVATLTAGPVQISGTIRSGTGTTKLAQVTVTAETTYPNGRDCPGEAPQAAVRVTPTGLR